MPDYVMKTITAVFDSSVSLSTEVQTAMSGVGWSFSESGGVTTGLAVAIDPAWQEPFKLMAQGAAGGPSLVTVTMEPI